MSKKIIAFVYHDMRIGGAEKELIAYMISLNKQQYDIHLCLTYANGELLATLPSHITVHEVHGNSYKPDIRHLFNLFRVLKRIHPDVVVGALQEININILSVKLLGLLPYKAIITEHIILSEWQHHIHTGWLKKIIVRFLYKRADLCIVQTAPIQKDLMELTGLKEHKFFIVPNYVTWPDRNINLKRTRHTHIPYFLFVGRVTRQKNIRLLLYAYRNVLRNAGGTCPALLIVGPHKHSHLISVVRLLGISRNVLFLGYRDEPWEFYKYAYATVIPSLIEGRCRAMIEAMMMKSPIITSNFTGHDDYITHMAEGLVFNKSSVQSLTDSLMYAISHPSEMKRLGKAGHRRISTVYDPHFYRTYPKLVRAAIQKAIATVS